MNQLKTKKIKSGLKVTLTLPTLAVHIALPKEGQVISTPTFVVFGYVIPSTDVAIAALDGWTSVTSDPAHPVVLQYFPPGSFIRDHTGAFDWRVTFDKPLGAGTMTVTVRVTLSAGTDQHVRTFSFGP